MLEVAGWKVGDQAKFKLPASWPPWITQHSYQVDWRDALVLKKDQIVTLVDICRSVTWTGMDRPHHFAEVKNFKFLICLDWLEHLKIPCDCPLEKILLRGCQKPHHQ